MKTASSGMTNVVSASPAHRVEDVSASSTASLLGVRLEIIRGDLRIQLEILAMLLELARAYITMPTPDDEHFVGAMTDARDRFKLALARAGDLQRERAESAITREAAAEWHAQRGGRRA